MIIKDRSEDFIVKELPLKEWADAGEYAVFELTKIDMNTEGAISIVTKKLNVKQDKIKYSGTKDKRAITTQYISIPARNGLESINIDESNFKLKFVGYSEEPLSLGTLKGNRFVITVREPSNEELKSLNSKKSDSFIIPNYFDDQRFSTNNLNIGICILKKEYAKAVDLLLSDPYYDNTLRPRFEAFPNDHVGMLQHIPQKILLMFVHAVQSYIYNEALSRMLLECAIKNDIIYYTVDYSIGKLIFYANPSDYQKIDVESLELAGFDTHTTSHRIEAVLNSMGLTHRDFIIRALPNISVEGTTRASLVIVESLEKKVLDGRVIIEFDLSKGSYATMVLKALFNG